MRETRLTLETNRPADLAMEELCSKRGLTNSVHASWPHEPGVVATDIGLDVVACDYYEGLQTAVWKHELGAAQITTHDGNLEVRAASSTVENAFKIAEDVKAILTPREDTDPDVVPVNFWTASQHGGRNIKRDIDVCDWDSILANYPENAKLSALMSPDFNPGVGGQLILWHGEPGTGKTTALRALANAWRGWCDLHYIVDPEVFFGDRADYMMEVLTSQDVEYVSPEKKTGDPATRWRLLVLEDCGELLQPDAREEVGQALSRLLNACDGLIGRGLRLLVLVTTNEPIGKLHDAVSRPGRCAARIEFDRLTREQAEEWLTDHDVFGVETPSRPTIADLYGKIEGFQSNGMDDHQIGFVRD